MGGIKSIGDAANQVIPGLDALLGRVRAINQEVTRGASIGSGGGGGGSSLGGGLGGGRLSSGGGGGSSLLAKQVVAELIPQIQNLLGPASGTIARLQGWF